MTGSNGKGIAVGFLAAPARFPPTTGYAIRIYQVWKRLQKLGVRPHSCVEMPLEGYVRHARTDQGLREMLSQIDVLDVIFPALPSRRIHLELLLKGGFPIVWETEAPYEQFSRLKESNAFSRAKVKLATHVFASKLARRRVTISTALGQYWEKKLGRKFDAIIPCGSDPEVFKPPEPDPERENKSGLRVLWAGKMGIAWHGLELIRRAAVECEKRWPDVQFVMAGGAKPPDQAWPAGVQFLGWVPYGEVHKEIARADIGLCLYEPYTWSPIGFYASPIKLYDYLSCGRAVIASDMGQIQEVVTNGENGLLCDNSLERLLECIGLLRNDPALRSRMGKNARETVVKHYNWDRAAEQLYEVFSSVAKCRTS